MDELSQSHSWRDVTNNTIVTFITHRKAGMVNQVIYQGSQYVRYRGVHA